MTGKEYSSADKWLRLQYRLALRVPSMFEFNPKDGLEAAQSECSECLSSFMVLNEGLCASCTIEKLRRAPSTSAPPSLVA